MNSFKHVIYLQPSNTSENNMAAQYGKIKFQFFWSNVNVIKKCLFLLCKIAAQFGPKNWLNNQYQYKIIIVIILIITPIIIITKNIRQNKLVF